MLFVLLYADPVVNRLQKMNFAPDFYSERSQKCKWVFRCTSPFRILRVNNNVTLFFKVLDDGTVVGINKTVIADTNDDGSKFFFHSTFHNIRKTEQDKENDDKEKNVDDKQAETTSKTTEKVQNIEDEDSGNGNVDDGLLVGSN